MKRESPKTKGEQDKVSELPHALAFPGREKLRLDECAKAIMCSQDHLMNLIKAGDFPGIDGAAFSKLRPRERMIPVQSWRDWLASRWTGSGDASHSPKKKGPRK